MSLALATGMWVRESYVIFRWELSGDELPHPLPSSCGGFLSDDDLTSIPHWIYDLGLSVTLTKLTHPEDTPEGNSVSDF
jgi:hypothetical protein